MHINSVDELTAQFPALVAELERSQTLGTIGPRDLEDHLHHALGYSAVLKGLGISSGQCADLGPGAGLPSLVIAATMPATDWTLIERRERSVARLDITISRVGWIDRVRCWLGDAEDAGRDLRGQFDLVTARGFGPPAMTAECAAPLLRIGGTLVVSEPPGEQTRWPKEGLLTLGLAPNPQIDPLYWSATKISTTPDNFPRRVGVPRRKPIW